MDPAKRERSDLAPGADASRARARVFDVVFESVTPAGKAFDVALIGTILASTLVVMLESVASIRAEHGELLRELEWLFTVVFTVEYGTRLWCVGRPARYARSFFGVVDLLSILPTYASLLLPGAQYLLIIRTLRILRIFRVLKLVHYVREVESLSEALLASRRKIFVFVYTLLALVAILGSLMYLIEGAENGFTSIPRGIYWAIVTMTTVGYGDVSPQTTAGQTLAAFIMMLGYGIIAVPTGIVTAELTQVRTRQRAARPCPGCAADDHDADARHCKHCGAPLRAQASSGRQR